MNDFILGVDLGKAQDNSGLVLMSRRPLGEKEFSLAIVYIENVPLGTHYKVVIDKMASFARDSRLRNSLTIGFDRTGLGNVVSEMIYEIPELAEITYGVSITSGRQSRHDADDKTHFTVPKKDIVGAIQVPLQNGRLRHRHDLPNFSLLHKQLLEFQGEKSSASDSILFDAKGSGHDDLVLALGIGCWIANIAPFQSGLYVPTAAVPARLDVGSNQRYQGGGSWRDSIIRPRA